ncbi:MAG: siphovirus ReqiPepy6 Gp37-like family protein [Clostridia bacterium]|jgi:hypothetical protein|nr:siphovirus ReqiPepy6 Gp37-like family protein [Clostridia bacterium]
MELYIFGPTIGTPIGIIDAFISLQWIRRYYKAGEFDLIVPVTDDNVTILQKCNLVWKKGENEAGYIYYRHFSLSDTGQEQLEVKGKFLTGYLGQRIIWDTMYISDTAENVMRTLVNKSAINPTITARTIPLLSLGTSQGFTPTAIYQTPDGSRDNLADELEILSTAAELGHRITFDPENSTLKFDIYVGLDRSTEQTQNVPAIFSREFENVLTQEYTDSDDNLKNVALLNGIFKTGSGETEVNTPVSVTAGSATGLDRYEEYIDGGTQSESTKDADGNVITITQAQYESALTDTGTADLAEHQEVETFDSTIDINSNLVYKTDWDLGDICPCLNKQWGVVVNARITEITEVYEESGTTITPTFGNNVPTIIDKIKNMR